MKIMNVEDTFSQTWKCLLSLVTLHSKCFYWCHILFNTIKTLLHYVPTNSIRRQAQRSGIFTHTHKSFLVVKNYCTCTCADALQFIKALSTCSLDKFLNALIVNGNKYLAMLGFDILTLFVIRYWYFDRLITNILTKVRNISP